MILHSIELEFVGPFVQTVRVGPFLPGLNILAAPNERGKTTVIRAAARSLFDKHTTKDPELRSLQPAGTGLSPRVLVDFETAAGRYKIEKTFLTNPRSQLSKFQGGDWQLIEQADEADRQLQKILKSTLPGRGATKPEHWGLMGFLWARQGEAADWPDLNQNPVGTEIRSRLARVEVDPLIEKLRQSLAARAEEIFTAGGAVRKNGPLAIAEAELAGIQKSLEEIANSREEMMRHQQRFQEAEAALIRLEKEEQIRAEDAQKFQALAASGELGQVELKQREMELDQAGHRLAAITRDMESLHKRQLDLGEVEAEFVKAELEAVEAHTQVQKIRQNLDATQSKRPSLESELAKLRAEAQRNQALLRLQRLSARSAELNSRMETARNTRAEMDLIQGKLKALPDISPANLNKIQSLSEQVRDLKTQVEALGITVELRPDHPSKLSFRSADIEQSMEIPGGKHEVLQQPQWLDLDLEGWGKISIRSGATEVRDVAETLRKAQQALEANLQEIGVHSLEEARQAVSARKDLEGEFKRAREQHTRQLGDQESLETLDAAWTDSCLRCAQLKERWNPTSEEMGLTLSALESVEAGIAEQIPSLEKQLLDLDRELETHRKQEREALSQQQKSLDGVKERETRKQVLEVQISDLKSRYVDGIEAAKQSAQLAFAQAEGRVMLVKSQLPPDYEQLPERNRRAAAALQQIQNEVRQQRSIRDSARGTLEVLGSMGLYSKETELEEKRAEVIARRDAVRDAGRAARIAQDLIELRKLAATRAVLSPLEDRLSQAFENFTGVAGRRVFLDEQLRVEGIGAERGAAYAFESLSQGAREQLLLCLRLAVAGELSVDEPQVLILDDVLVNTDATRQERILDALTGLTDGLQVVILSCHPERFRGVGEMLGFSPFKV